MPLSRQLLFQSSLQASVNQLFALAHDDAHDFFLRCLGALELADKNAPVHDADAVTDPEQFRHFRRDHDDSLAGIGEFVDDAIDLVLGADVDTAGRFIENQDFRIGKQPFRQHYLLLVAAGQVAGCLIDVGAADAHAVAIIARHLQLLDIIDDAADRNTVEIGQRDVLADIVGEQEAELLAVLGDIGKTGVDGAADGREVDFAAVQYGAAGDLAAPGTAEQAHGEFGTPGAHQACDADDLAAANMEVDIPDDLPIHMLGMINRPVIDLEHHLAYLGLALGKAMLEVAIHHLADDAILLESASLAIQRIDGATIAQHGDAVGDTSHLVELVRDQDRGHAMGAEFKQKIEQRRAVAFIEACSRLVKNQKAHLLGQRLGDFHQLLLADPDISDQRVRRLVEPDFCQQLLRPLVDRVAIDHAEPRRRVGDENILGDREQRDQREFLMDDDDAERLGIVDVAEVPLLAVIDDAAVVVAVGIDAAQHLHQRRLAGAVLAHQGMDLALPDGEIDVVQRLHAGEGFADTAHFEQCGQFRLP